MLAEPILVLNKSWRVIGITTVQKALTLLYTEAAYAIAPETYEAYDFLSWIEIKAPHGQPFIRTMRYRIRIPEIIQVRCYDGCPPQSIHFSRKNIYKRDDYTCQYCNTQPGLAELTVDHVLPRSRGGRSDWLNCVSACARCNKKKGNRTLDEVPMRLLRKPFKPDGSNAIFFPLTAIKRSWESFMKPEKSLKHEG